MAYILMYHPTHARMHRRGRMNRGWGRKRGRQEEREKHRRCKHTAATQFISQVRMIYSVWRVRARALVMMNGCGEVVCISQSAQYGFLLVTVSGGVDAPTGQNTHTHAHPVSVCWGRGEASTDRDGVTRPRRRHSS